MRPLDRRAFLTPGRRLSAASAPASPFQALQSGQLNAATAGEPLSLSFQGLLQARSAAPPESGLKPYSGPWTALEVIHLLRRLTFGASKDDVKYYLAKTPAQAIDEIINAPYEKPPLPVNDYNNPDFTDPNIPFGETWTDAKILEDGEGYRVESLRAWWVRLMMDGKRCFREKMTLFWHNHMPIQFYEIFYGAFLYRHLDMLRENALGNMKDLVRKTTLDPAMLYYLNGYLNSKTAPDENYAREIQELFVVGKDLPSYFTESDVKAAARLLTGWRIYEFGTFFDPSEHDTGDKQFSAFYGNRKIKGRNGPAAGDAELDEFLDMLFAHPEPARFICRKIYRFFVFHDIDALTEQNVIEPLAAILRAANYDIKPVLKTLFASEHFFDALNRGVMIKSPVDLTVGLFRQFGVSLPGDADLLDNFIISFYLSYTMGEMLQYPGDPPNVAGWAAYYQKPTLDKLWINTGTLPRRGQFGEAMVYYGYSGSNHTAVINVLDWAQTLDHPEDVNALIEETLALHLGMPVSKKVKSYLKTVLLSDLPSDYYWAIAWNAWLEKPEDETLKGVVETRLKAFLWTLLQMEEYQLA